MNKGYLISKSALDKIDEIILDKKSFEEQIKKE
jgi:hypothetical protein